MIVKLHSKRPQTLEEIRAFLTGATPLDFEVPSREEAYDWMETALRELAYLRLGKADKGLVRAYLARLSGFSRAQVTRLIKQFAHGGALLDRRERPANAFTKRHLAQDVVLLAEVDALQSNGTLSGPATHKLCERAYRLFGERVWRESPTATSTTSDSPKPTSTSNPTSKRTGLQMSRTWQYA
jgi:hypothetical protein